MIKTIATICILAAGTTAALANDTQQGQASRQPAGMQRTAHNPYDANAKMMMKKKHHHMRKSMAKEKPADGGMTNNWFGNDNKNQANNDWFKNDNDAAPKKGKMKKSADTSNDWFGNWNKNDANKGGMK